MKGPISAVKDVRHKLDTYDEVQKTNEMLKSRTQELETRTASLQQYSNTMSKWSQETVTYMQELKDRYETLQKTVTDQRANIQHLTKAPMIVPFPQNSEACRSMVFRVPVLRTIIENLNTETFRVLPELVPRYLSKCPICGAEYMEDKKVCDNPECTIQAVPCTAPDIKQKKVFQDWAKKVNINGQSIFDLVKEWDWENLVTDNSWLIVSYDYKLDDMGMIAGRTPVEFVGARPEFMRLVQDDYGRPGGLHWVCPIHRGKKDHKFSREEVERGETCKVQGCNGIPVMVTAYSMKHGIPHSGNLNEEIDKYYIDGEWYHDVYWTRTKGYGISPIYTLWILASALWYMDELENNTYKHGRPPKSIMVFNTMNAPSLESQLNKELIRSQENRNYIPKLAYASEGKTPATVLHTMPSDEELNNLEHRKDIRDRAGALYGQSPFMLNDVNVGSGLNNEGMQQTTMLRRVESRYNYLEEGIWRFWLDVIGVTDFKMKWPPNKEEDRMAVIERRKQNIQMIGEILDRGGDYRILNKDDFEFEILGKMGQKPRELGAQQLGGSGWSPKDWQHKDSTFAFSMKFKKAEGDPLVEDIIVDMHKAIYQVLSDLMERSGMLYSNPYAYREMLFEYLSSIRDRLVDAGYTIYARGIRIGADSLDIPIDEAWITTDQVSDLITASDYFRAVNEFVDQLGEKISGSIDGALVDDKSFTPEGLAREISNNFIDISSSQLANIDNILRTEATYMTNVGRVAGYQMQDPEDDLYDYDWVGPDYVEGRSTLVCQAIKDRVSELRQKQGRVSLTDLERIIAEEGSIPHGDEKAFNMGRPFLPHYKCRHGVVASNRMGKGLVRVAEESEVPPGKNIVHGPRGGIYYESESEEDESNEEDEQDGQPERVNRKPEQDGEGRPQVEAHHEYVALGQRQGNSEWHLKYVPKDKLEQVMAEVEQQGYEVDETPVDVEVHEVRGGEP